MSRNNGRGESNVEMSDVRLLDEDETDDTLPFGQSNLTSVLANPDFVRRRPWDRFVHFLQERPHPLFNFPTAGFAVLTLLFLILFLVSTLSAPKGDTVSRAGTSSDVLSGSANDDTAMLYDYKGRPRMVSSERGMVAADQGDCSALGVTILEQGGNAVDASITTALCQGIMSPAASGLGGGHFMVIRSPNGTTEVIDAREPAPAAANETMFSGNPDAAVNGGLAIAVPLELKGLWMAWQRHGSMLWADLVTPVIPLAQNGFPLHPYLADEIGDGEWLKPYPTLYKTFMIQDGARWRPPAVNESCCARPQLAATLQRIAADGPDAVYTGQAGQALAGEIQAANGIVTAQDLLSAQPVVKQPITAQVHSVKPMLTLTCICKVMHTSVPPSCQAVLQCDACRCSDEWTRKQLSVDLYLKRICLSAQGVGVRAGCAPSPIIRCNCHPSPPHTVRFCCPLWRCQCTGQPPLGGSHKGCLCPEDATGGPWA